MKYSKTAIGLLTAQYRSVLKKCFLINMGLFALGAIATPAKADTPIHNSVSGPNGTALLFNENDGGGAQFTNNDGTISYVGVNDGGADGLTVQIYSKDSSTNVGTRLNVTNNGIYYTTGTDSISYDEGNLLATTNSVADQISDAVTSDTGVVKTAIANATDDMATKTWVGEQGYQTADNVTSAINTALTGYSTTAQMNSAISTATAGMATQSWVAGQGYQTSAQVDSAVSAATAGMATQSWVAGQGYQTSAQVNSAVSAATAGMATQSWVEGKGYQTSAQVGDAINTALTDYSTTTQMNTAITNAVNGLDADVSQTASAANPLNLSITETNGVITAISGSIAANTFDAYGAAADVDAKLGTGFDSTNTVAAALSNKQDTLTAGSNITISGNTISATDTDTTYAAGAGITITGTENTIAVNLDTVAETTDHKVMTADERTKLAGIEAGAEVNVVETIKVNGAALTPDASKAVDITVTGGSTNGTIAVNGADVAVTGLAAAAYKGVDTAVTASSANLVTSGAVSTALEAKVNTADVVAYNKNTTPTAGQIYSASSVKDNLDLAGTALQTVTANGSDVTGTSKTIAIAEGSANGTIAVNGANVAVHGLNTAAYRDVDATITGSGSSTNLVTSGAVVAYTGAAIEDALEDAIKHNPSTNKIDFSIGTSNFTAYDVAGTDAAIEDAIEDAITFNTNNTVTLTVGSNSANIYDTTGTANYVKENAQNADYTAATSGAVDLKSNSTIAQALQTLDTNKASLAEDNTFTGANTFKSDSGITITNKTDSTITSNLVAKEVSIGGETHNVLQLTVSDPSDHGSALYVKDADVVTNGGFMALDANGTDRFSADEDGIELKNDDGDTTFSVDSATGNTAVAGTMDIEGDTTIGDKFSVTAADGSFSAAGGKFTVDGDGAIVAANGGFTVAADGKTAVGSDFRVSDTFTVEAATGNTAVGGDFRVRDTFTVDADTGNTIVGGTLAVANAKFTVDGDGAISVASGNFTADKDGNVTAAGTMDIEGDTTIGDKFSVTAADGSMSAADGNFTVSADGNIAVAGTADIEGDTTIGGTLDVTGLASLDGGINVNEKFSVDTDGNTTVLGNLGVAGTAFLNAASVTNDLGVGGNATIAQNLGVGGTAFLNAASVTNDLGVGGNATVAENFSVGGTSFLKDTTVDGGLGVTGNATVVGTAMVGALTFNGTDKVNAIDTGTAAITDGDATTTARKETMATTATVAKTIGNLAALENTHGVTSVADVASAINSLATNVETATGGTFTNDTWKATVTMADSADYTYGGAAGHNNLMGFVNDLASNIGDGSNLGSKNDAINTGTATNVASGLKAAGDAIGDMNFGSSHYVSAENDLSGAVRTLDSNLYRVETDLRDLKRDFNRGMASMAAMSALVPNPRAHGNTSLAIGTGAYSGHTAAAIGGFHYLTDNIMLNAGAAWGNSSDVSYRMGVTFSW